MKKLLIFSISILFISFSSLAQEIGGIIMPETIKAGDSNLDLNGAGIRTKYFLKLYVGGLYLTDRDADVSKIINGNEPMAIRLHIVSSMITSEKMENSTREGFDKSLGGNIDPLKGEIEMFIAVFKEEIKIDDTYNMVYIPDVGVEIYKNDKLSSTIKGLEFKKALFGIWLGKEPAQESLKEKMLGR
ncbi:MAG: chalcone isomerase family protein [Bacteroidota bacterium]